jgi:hypothetical protein
MKRTIYSALIALSSVVCMNAQEEVSHFTFQAGAGFTQGVGRTGTYTDTGWNTSLGFGYNFNSYVGALINLNDSQLGINSATLSNIGEPGGGINMLTATLDPVIHLTPHSHFDLYVTGGGGMFRRYQDFSAPALVPVSGFNHFFGFYPATEILSSYSVIKPGVDVGVGVALGTKWHGKFYAEAKYDKMYNGLQHTDFLPVTFGFRW